MKTAIAGVVSGEIIFGIASACDVSFWLLVAVICLGFLNGWMVRDWETKGGTP